MTVEHTLDVSEEEDAVLTIRANQYRMTVREYLGFVVSHHALGRRLPPPPVEPRHRAPASERLRQRIAERAASGQDTTQIAAIYGTTPATVRRLRDGIATKEKA